MATTIKTKNSTTGSTVPTGLVQGELAVNITDKKLYVGDAVGNSVQIAGAGATNAAGGSNTQVQYNSSGALAGSSNMTFDGTTLTVNGLATTGTVTLGDASGDALTINSSAVSIPNGLNFDSNTFVIDATNNRVGVGTASPSYPLDVYGASSDVARIYYPASGVQTSKLWFGTLSNTAQAYVAATTLSGSTGTLEFGTGATERNMNISREFKMLAMTNNIPVIDITAATADDISDQDEPPMMSQVAWSKAIEYDADMAMAIHRYPGTNMIEVVSRKNRHGQEFDFYLDWDINRGIIKELYDYNPPQKD